MLLPHRAVADARKSVRGRNADIQDLNEAIILFQNKHISVKITNKYNFSFNNSSIHHVLILLRFE